MAHGALGGKVARLKNTNQLVGKKGWDILLSKTGFTNEAGRSAVSGWRTHLENGDSVGDDGVHQGFRWTPWNTPSALGGVTMTS